MSAPRQHPAAIVLVLASTALVGWTILTLGTGLLERLDAALVGPHLAPGRTFTRVVDALAWFTHPVLLIGPLPAMALYARQRHHRRLTWALLLCGPIGWLANLTIEVFADRPFPPADLHGPITGFGSSYPAAAMTLATITAAMVLLATISAYAPRRVTVATAIAGGLLIGLVGWTRWLLDAHWFTDLVAGVLLGVVIAACCALIVGSALPDHRPPATAEKATSPLPQPRPAPRCVVIHNPSKLADEAAFRREVTAAMHRAGWQDPLWMPTAPDDPGHSMTRAALAARPELVMAVGGDGTVRVVSSGLAGAGVRFAVIPAGTGNLLAKNLGIPLDQQEALKVALHGRCVPIDLVRLVVDGRQQEAEHFAVMAGMGFDAKMMAATDATLKRVVGSGAYAVAFIKEIGTRPHRTRIRIDDQAPIVRQAVLTVIGNVAELQGGIALLPRARPDDGEVNLVVASPTSLRQWMRTLAVVVGKLRRREMVQEFSGSRLVIDVDEPLEYQMDGDLQGTGCHFEATVVPKALPIMLPGPG